MSYYQDGIIHLPASTYHPHHGAGTASSGASSSSPTIAASGPSPASTLGASVQPYVSGGINSSGNNNAHRLFHSSNYGSTSMSSYPLSSSVGPIPTGMNLSLPSSSSHGTGSSAVAHLPPPPNSGNLSLESRDSLMEAGEMLTSTAPSSGTRRRHKADIVVVFSIISFLVWLRLFQAMFYSSVLGHLEGFAKDLLFILLVWVPSIMLTCFYFRSDNNQNLLNRLRLR